MTLEELLHSSKWDYMTIASSCQYSLFWDYIDNSAMHINLLHGIALQSFSRIN